MKVIYSQEKKDTGPGESIFLAGPSPRKDGHYNWRPEALEILEEMGFGGSVFVPLPRDGNWPDNYDDQVEWELEHLDMATVIVFWIPRDLKDLPAFTTNVEYGLYVNSGKVVLGYPEGAAKMKYLAHLAEKYNIPISHTLRDTLEKALALSASLMP